MRAFFEAILHDETRRLSSEEIEFRHVTLNRSSRIFPVERTNAGTPSLPQLIPACKNTLSETVNGRVELPYLVHTLHSTPTGGNLPMTYRNG